MKNILPVYQQLIISKQINFFLSFKRTQNNITNLNYLHIDGMTLELLLIVMLIQFDPIFAFFQFSIFVLFNEVI